MVVNLYLIQTAIEVVAQRRVSGLADVEKGVIAAGACHLQRRNRTQYTIYVERNVVVQADRDRDVVPLAVVDLGCIGRDFVAIYGSVVRPYSKAKVPAAVVLKT